jgi:NAD(P)-dependent dehydrogenase (short-subunit alcohol dehydrogenase family)
VPSSEPLRGRRAVVTGAAGGIGRAIAGALAAAGAELILVDSDAAALERSGAELGCATVLADLAAEQGALAERLLRDHGTVELIVNNVGITTPARFRELTPADFDLVMATNLRGPLFFTRRLVDALGDAGRGGSILFISSLHSSRIRHRPHYSASKAAVAMLVRELAHELGPLGIRVNALSPGWIDTRPGQPAPAAAGELVPLRRVGRPEDVATVAVALLDDAVTGYVTGADVPVDGGLALYSWLDALDA